MINKVVDLLTPAVRPRHTLMHNAGDSAMYMNLDVGIALLPLVAFAVYLHSPSSLLPLVVCMATCVLSDALCSLALGGDLYPMSDFSSPVCGALLAVCISPHSSLLMCVLASLVCSLAVKNLAGSLVRLPAHPVVITLSILLLLSPFGSFTETRAPFTGAEAQSVPELMIAEQIQGLYWYDELFGKVAAPLGCASALLVIAGGVYLVVRGITDAKVSIAYVAGACVATYFLSPGSNPFEYVLRMGLCGQGLLVAFFFISDKRYIPKDKDLALALGAGCGALAAFLCFKLTPNAAFLLSATAGGVLARICDIFKKPVKPFGKA